MATGSVNVTSLHVADVRVPLFTAPYSADDTSQVFLQNSFDPVLYHNSSVQPAGIYAQTILTSLLAPLRKSTTKLGSGNDSGHSWGSPMEVAGQYATVVADDGPTGGGSQAGTVEFVAALNLTGGTKQLNQQPGSIESLVIKSPPTGFPILIVVEISQSPPTYIPVIYFASFANDVVHNCYGLELFNPIGAGNPFGVYVGAGFQGNIVAGKIIPQLSTLVFPNSLIYADSTLHILPAQAVLPDLDRLTNVFIIVDANNGVPFRTIEFQPGNLPLNTAFFNSDGLMKFITFDDPTLNTAMLSGSQILQASRKGFLLTCSGTYKGQSRLVFMKPDASGYYNLVREGQDATANAVIANSQNYAVDQNGILYAKQNGSVSIANSFGTSLPIQYPSTLSLQPLTLPCFDPCLPWPVALPDLGV